MKQDFVIYGIKMSILAVIGMLTYIMFLSINTKANRKHIASTFDVAIEKIDAYLATQGTNDANYVVYTVGSAGEHTYIRFNTGCKNEWGVHDPDCIKCKK